MDSENIFELSFNLHFNFLSQHNSFKWCDWRNCRYSVEYGVILWRGIFFGSSKITPAAGCHECRFLWKNISRIKWEFLKFYEIFHPDVSQVADGLIDVNLILWNVLVSKVVKQLMDDKYWEAISQKSSSLCK